MTNQIKVGPVHHLRLTVTDVNRSREFYTGVLGFEVAMAEPPPADDRFSVESRADLERAVQVLDEREVPHGEIKNLGPFGIYVLAFRDPDNIQLELTAPH